MSNISLILTSWMTGVNMSAERVLSFEEDLAQRTIYSPETISKFKYCYKDLSNDEIESILLKLSQIRENNIFQSINFDALLTENFFFAFPDKFQFKKFEIEEIGKILNKINTPDRVSKARRDVKRRSRNFF
jgi:hypothetical protein